MKCSKFRILNTFYWPWLFDILIALLSLTSVLYFASLAFSNYQTLEIWASLISIFPFLYSLNNAMTKKNEDRKLKDNFVSSIGPLFGDCRSIITKHYPETAPLVAFLEERVIRTHFDDWKKFQNIRSFEYQLLGTLLDNLAVMLKMDNSDRLLLKYILVTSSFSYHYPNLVSELENGDYYTEGSPHNIFIRKLHEFTNSGKLLSEIQAPNVTPDIIEETINIALNTNFAFIKDLLEERENRRKIEYLLNKCFENAYTNAGSLNLELKDDDARKLVFLYKYDERYSILKRLLHQAIRDQIRDQHKDVEEENLERMNDDAQGRLANIMYPLPLSKAIADFPYCIERLTPRDNFAFIIYPDKFGPDAAGWSALKFMVERVIPRAQMYQDEFNKKIVVEFPYLKEHQKKVLDANFYLFEFSRRNFSHHATQDAIPVAIKRFLVKDVLDSEKAGDIIASQLIYLKQVINNLSLSGLLFTEDRVTQETVRKIENRLIRLAKREGLLIQNIYDLISIGNQFDLFVEILHGLVHNAELKRRVGKKYEESLRIATTMIGNAEEIINVFNSIH